jgi:hypothetical protein
MDQYLNFQLQMEAEAEADDIEDDHQLQLAFAVGIMYAGAEEARLDRSDLRHSSRLYLCRAQLLPNPRIDTPWVQLHRSRSDRAYITTMGIDVACFDRIIEEGFGRTWNETPIPRDDTNAEAPARPGTRSLDAEGGLGLVLHYLNSTMREISLQQIFALIPSTVSRYLIFAMEILLQTLRITADARVTWFHKQSEFQAHNDLVRQRHPLLTGAFASIDGLNIPVQTSSDIDIENATYNGWLSEHFISCVLVFSASGACIHIAMSVMFLTLSRSHYCCAHQCARQLA